MLRATHSHSFYKKQAQLWAWALAEPTSVAVPFPSKPASPTTHLRGSAVDQLVQQRLEHEAVRLVHQRNLEAGQ